MFNVKKILAVTLAASVCFSGTVLFCNAKNQKKVHINKTSAELNVGESVKLNLKNAVSKKISWSSKDSGIAKVTKNGKVTAVKDGNTKVSANYMKKKYTCKITVKKVEKPANSTEPAKLSTLAQGTDMLDSLYNGENIIVSPTSLNLALGMAANAANDTVKECFEDYLGTSSIDDYNDKSHNFMNYSNDGEILKTANAIWYKDVYEINETFKDTLENKYLATVKKSALDSSTIDEVNKWCSDNTDKMIPEILKEINTDTSILLLNALLFDGQWTTPFSENATKKDDFTGFDGKKSKVDMMESDSESIYYENEYATAFEKTYGDNGEYSFIGILPKKEGEFKLSKLDIDGLLKTKNTKCVVMVYLPKFTYNWRENITDMLTNSVLAPAFDSKTNPLSKAFNLKEGYSTYISQVDQACKIIVDEQGTKAAAVTMVSIETCAAVVGMEYKTVRLDRPFAYLIRDNKNDEILFAGKCVMPQ